MFINIYNSLIIREKIKNEKLKVKTATVADFPSNKAMGRGDQISTTFRQINAALRFLFFRAKLSDKQ